MTSRMSAGGQQARLGKYIGGGMSFGAFGGRTRLTERYDPRRADAIPHAATFNNNVLTMAAALAGLSRIFTAEVADALFARGEALRAQLHALSPGLPLRWTDLGSLMTVHFQREPIASPADLRPDAGLRELFFLDMLERGFYLARRGMLAMSLEIGAAEADGFVAAVADFIESRGSLLRGVTQACHVAS